MENSGKHVSQGELFLLKELPKQMKTTTTLKELIELVRDNGFGSSEEDVEEKVMLAFVKGYNDGAPQRRPKQQQKKKTKMTKKTKKAKTMHPRSCSARFAR